MQNVLTTISDTELEILKLIKKGLTSLEISKIRNCSARTVEKHRSNIIKKLGIATSQHALIVWIMEHPTFFD